MNQRFLLATALVAAALVALGLLVIDVPLARWIHASGYENAAFFEHGLGMLDRVFGLKVWYWIAVAVCVPLGLIGLVLTPRLRLPHGLAAAILAAGLVQAITIGAMILGKNLFGRLRPQQVFESGDWSALWFVGGGSFPSGHAAFYCGLLLPLAACAPRLWQRVVLISLVVFVAMARLDMARHFLSDVAMSALLAAGACLLVSRLLRRWLPAR
jgi:membrane-associated phospholipid phosphatase